MSDPETPGRSRAASEPLDSKSTGSLLALARLGRSTAFNRLWQRCVPPLRRWGHGRVPPEVRDIHDTADVVQDAIAATLGRLDHFEPRHPGALQAYVRQVFTNRIKDLVRSRRRRPLPSELPEDLADTTISPLDQAIGAENRARYDAALQRLHASDREAIIGRLERHYSYDELKRVLGKPTAGAARLAVVRAVQRLTHELRKS